MLLHASRFAEMLGMGMSQAGMLLHTQTNKSLLITYLFSYLSVQLLICSLTYLFSHTFGQLPIWSVKC